jgi:hypothetical protein
MTMTPDGTARREGRGFVHSFGRNRTCVTTGCTTQLSRYNKAAFCWIHDEEQDGKR